MEAKTTRFLTQFSRAVFQQWTQSPENEKFWEDGATLNAILKEAVAKLPSGKFKAQLVRDLTLLETQLAMLLRDLHATYIQKHQTDTNKIPGVPLNEMVTKLMLTQADAAPAEQRKLASVLALDTGIDIACGTPDTHTEDVEQLVHLFALIAARGYEAPKEQQHKRGLVLRRLAARVQQQIQTLPSNWCCSDASKQVIQLRTLLERIVVQDVVALAQDSPAQQSESFSTGKLKAPWTMFYRPDESLELRQVDYDEEMAKIYGALLRLAIYFPIDAHSNEEETSNESSEDEKGHTLKHSSHEKHLQSGVAQAQVTTRQVLLSAQRRQRGLYQNGQWLILVLTFLHSLAKPVTYYDEDGGEALDVQDRHALLDCLGQVYSYAFASVKLFDQAKESVTEEKIAKQDRALFNAILCLRHAAHFMHNERKSSLPAVTTAMAYLAGVPLPASLVSWLDHEQVANPMSVIEKAIQGLWKQCIDHNGMNILLNSAKVTTEQLLLIQKSYFKFLNEMAGGNSKRPKALLISSTSADAAKEAAVDDSSLFYVDNSGGEDKENTRKSKKNRANKKKKKRGNEGTALTSLKRSK